MDNKDANVEKEISIFENAEILYKWAMSKYDMQTKRSRKKGDKIYRAYTKFLKENYGENWKMIKLLSLTD